MEVGLLLIILLLVLAIYFVPWIVAHNRRHPNTSAIVVLNIFTGWTFVGWVIALVWASSGPPGTEPATNFIPAAAEPAQPVAPAFRACPMCAEQILAAARKCKHCGSEIHPLASQETS